MSPFTGEETQTAVKAVEAGLGGKLRKTR